MTERIVMAKVLAAKYKKLGVNIARWKAGEPDPRAVAPYEVASLLIAVWQEATIQEIVDELDLGIQFRRECDAIE
jgi:hypothetical protein